MNIKDVLALAIYTSILRWLYACIMQCYVSSIDFTFIARSRVKNISGCNKKKLSRIATYVAFFTSSSSSNICADLIISLCFHYRLPHTCEKCAHEN